MLHYFGERQTTQITFPVLVNPTHCRNVHLLYIQALFEPRSPILRSFIATVDYTSLVKMKEIGRRQLYFVDGVATEVFV